MKRSQVALFTVAVLLHLATGSSAVETYSAKLLHPVGFDRSFAAGISANYQVGYGGFTGSIRDHAFIWTGSAASVVDLSPAGFSRSRALATTDTHQVGFARVNVNNGQTHAILWSGTAASAIDLNPPGFTFSSATGVSGDAQVGSGSMMSDANATHALLWRGSAASVVDLNPDGYTITRAAGVQGNSVIGWGGGPATSNTYHALLWPDGTANNYIDLYPIGSGYIEMIPVDISGNSQVGAGRTTLVHRNALLWYGSAASMVVLNPVGVDNCSANGVFGNTQVGNCELGSTGVVHAKLWQGSADSIVDLNDAAIALIPNAIGSNALDIDENGNITGYVLDANSRAHAVMWSPVPEPSTCVLSLAGILVSQWCRGRRRPRIC